MAIGYSQKTLRELAGVLFSHWIAILAFTVIITGATYFACVTAKKIYRSEVTLWARQSKAANPLEDQPDPMSRLEVFLKTQQEILLSDIVLRRTMVRLTNPSWKDEPVDLSSDPEKDNSVWQKWYNDVNSEAGRFSSKDVAKFRKEVKIVTPGGEDITKSEVFTIVVEQPQPPERAQLGAELLTQEYLIHRRLLQSEFDNSARDLLNKQLADLRENTLGEAEAKLAAFIDEDVKGNLLDLAQLQRAGSEVNHQKIRSAFQEELITIEAEISECEALKAEVLAQIPAKALEDGVETLTAEDIESAKLVIPEKVMTSNTIINKLKQKLADLIVERNALREQFSNEYAPVRQKTGEILGATRVIIGELMGELKAIDQHTVTMKARAAKIQGQVDDRDAIIDNLSSLYVKYESLNKDVELSRSLYDQKRKDLLEAETGRQMAQREVLITQVDKATLPDIDRPARPIVWLYTLIAGIAGFLLGVGYAFLVESYDHSVSTTDQAERYFGKQVLVTVPEISGGIIRK